MPFHATHIGQTGRSYEIRSDERERATDDSQQSTSGLPKRWVQVGASPAPAVTPVSFYPAYAPVDNNNKSNNNRQQWHHSRLTQHYLRCPHCFEKDDLSVAHNMKGKNQRRQSYDMCIQEALKIRRHKSVTGRGRNEDDI